MHQDECTNINARKKRLGFKLHGTEADPEEEALPEIVQPKLLMRSARML